MNLPNKISMTRILMSPLFIVLFFLDGVLQNNFIIAAVVFAIAAFTDFIDGHIARSRGLVTNLGKFLDAIADKVLVAVALIVLVTMKDTLFAQMGKAGDILYIATAVSICLIMAREFIISAFRQIAALSGFAMAAEKLGKYKTTFQDVAVTVLIASVDIFAMSATAGVIVAWIGFALFGVATVLTIISGVTYVLKYKKVLENA